MPKDPPGNPSGLGESEGSFTRVSGMQTKLHRWAAADPGRRFDDLFNLVCDPATLIVAFERVAGNRGPHCGRRWDDDRGCRGGRRDSRVLGPCARRAEGRVVSPVAGASAQDPETGRCGSGAQARYPDHHRRVVQAALKLVLEPIFEADFLPVSYGFRPRRRAMDAVAEIHLFGTKSYRWVLDADIEACLDASSHCSFR
jgi:RNA-directed DNA polymerase